MLVLFETPAGYAIFKVRVLLNQSVVFCCAFDLFPCMKTVMIFHTSEAPGREETAAVGESLQGLRESRSRK